MLELYLCFLNNLDKYRGHKLFIVRIIGIKILLPRSRDMYSPFYYSILFLLYSCYVAPYLHMQFDELSSTAFKHQIDLFTALIGNSLFSKIDEQL